MFPLGGTGERDLHAPPPPRQKNALTGLPLVKEWWNWVREALIGGLELVWEFEAQLLEGKFVPAQDSTPRNHQSKPLN